MPRLGKYELGKTIGRGKFAKVIAGVDTTMNRDVAVKVIEKSGMAQEKWQGQLKREVGIMRRLRHPNIVALEDVLQSKSRYYLVMELIPGGELFGCLVDAGRFSETVARNYFQQLCAALRHCHIRGIAHRDLKPENLLVSKDGKTLKITDFGLSACQMQEDFLQTVCGTPHYVAPEVIKDQYDPETGALKPKSSRAENDGYDGFKADTWSTGVVLYAMLAGHLPFDNRHLVTLFQKVESGKYKVPSHFSAQVEDLLSHMLTLDIKARYTIDEIIAHPWVQVDFDRTLLEDFPAAPIQEDESWSVVSVSTKIQPGADQNQGAKGKAATSDGAVTPTNAAKTSSNNLQTMTPLETLNGSPYADVEDDMPDSGPEAFLTKAPADAVPLLCGIITDKIGGTVVSQDTRRIATGKAFIKATCADPQCTYVIAVVEDTSGEGRSGIHVTGMSGLDSPAVTDRIRKVLFDEAANIGLIVDQSSSLPAMPSTPSVVQGAGTGASPSSKKASPKPSSTGLLPNISPRLPAMGAEP